MTEVTRQVLATGELTVEGRLTQASNATLLCRIDGDAMSYRCVYKPTSGERPLWDFPTGTLGHREVAMFELASAIGWDLIPLTVWREDGPFGPGMCQVWIEESDASVVDVVAPGAAPMDWISVLEAQDGEGRPVELVHSAAYDVQRLVVLDSIANNADRKGGHVLVDPDDRIWGIDHGVCFAAEDKLRTVLWGWVGETLPESVVADVRTLHDTLGEHHDPVDRWLSDDEREALRARLSRLLEQGSFPVPSPHWPAIPWPVF